MKSAGSTSSRNLLEKPRVSQDLELVENFVAARSPLVDHNKNTRNHLCCISASAAFMA